MTHLFAAPSVSTVVVWQPPTPDHDQHDPIALTLNHQRCRVISAEYKPDVLKAVLEQVPDLLLIYLQASGDEGYGLCKILRKLPRTSAVPIVFIGARDEGSELVQALRCGGNEYLKLPVTVEECWLRLERHLHTAKLVRKLEADKDNLHQQVWAFNRMLRQHEQMQVSLAEENQVLQRLAFVDGLTQIANRRYFNQQLPQLWQQAGSSGQPLSLLLCDIDYFKRYNDTYGHPAGDVCLQSVAEALVRGAHRQSDQVARYGGEEFAILLPATDTKGAQKVALAVQSEIERAQIPHQGSLVKPYVSLSIGICTLVPDSAQQPYEVLVHGADEALYTAKLRGRDRAVVNAPEGLVSIIQDHCECGELSPLTRNMPTKLVVNHTAQSDNLIYLDDAAIQGEEDQIGEHPGFEALRPSQMASVSPLRLSADKIPNQVS
ncbi:MAG: diguanylate cyclase [Phormidesmis sp. RL_2_1]|nr:diguanylate cyclase [Phormidesmis sp. RL_2_1]